MGNITLMETDGYVYEEILYPFHDEVSDMNFSLSEKEWFHFRFPNLDLLYDEDMKLDDYLMFDYKLQSNIFMVEERPIASLIILSIVILLSLIGNILVVVISVFCMRLRSLTIIFMLNLALSDLLFTVGLMFMVYEHIWGFLSLGDAACKVINFVSSAGFYSSIVFLVLMSVQRYIIIVHPLSAWKKGHWLTHVLICAWMVSILASLPVTVHSAAHPDSGGCNYSNKTALVAITSKENIIFVCAFLVMAFCYIRILQTIFKSTRNQRHRITGLACFLVATFFICWAPYNIMMFLCSLSYYHIPFPTQVCEHFYYAGYIYHLLALSRCCLNPVIYGLFGLIFRKTARKIFQRRATSNSA